MIQSRVLLFLAELGIGMANTFNEENKGWLIFKILRHPNELFAFFLLSSLVTRIYIFKVDK
jgi:hypothetical protein